MILNHIVSIFLLFLVRVESLNVEYRTEESLSRDKRFIGQPNKNYQECQTASGRSGHCKHIQHCSWSALANQRSLNFLGYMCVIEQFSIGVCCPDSVSDINSGPDFSRPRQADDDHIVWDKIDASNEKMDQTETTTTVSMRPQERGCGVSTKSFPKVTGGRPADPKEWPWMAALILRNSQSAHCGGVIITNRHVLTAAHCTYAYSKHELTVRLGEYKFSSPDESRSRDFHITDIRQHIEFDETTYEHDIAILKLHQSVLFNSYIWPVCIPPSGETFDGWNGIVTGWGTQLFGGPSADVLMEVSVPIWRNDDCQKSFVERIGNGTLCAGAREGGRDSCQGDSGGPLLVQLKNKRWISVGIVSWGINCGEKNRPGVYTRVNHYLSWIMENALF